MFKVIYPVNWVAISFKNSFRGETLQLLTVFKVIYQDKWVAISFKNSLRAETLQLLTMFKSFTTDGNLKRHVRSGVCSRSAEVFVQTNK
jgi:hypothetical protein